MRTETDIPLVAAACIYVAAKAEEAALHIKVVVTEARATFNGMQSGLPICYGSLMSLVQSMD